MGSRESGKPEERSGDSVCPESRTRLHQNTSAQFAPADRATERKACFGQNRIRSAGRKTETSGKAPRAGAQRAAGAGAAPRKQQKRKQPKKRQRRMPRKRKAKPTERNLSQRKKKPRHRRRHAKPSQLPPHRRSTRQKASCRCPSPVRP